jgi:membrane protein YqaA with SNARE-associated domain
MSDAPLLAVLTLAACIGTLVGGLCSWIISGWLQHAHDQDMKHCKSVTLLSTPQDRFLIRRIIQPQRKM